jgi:hypothetical protein
MLDLNCWILCGVWETLIASKHEMTDCDLVIAILGENRLAIIEHIDSKILWLHVGNFGKLLAVFLHFDVDRGTGVVHRADRHLFFENNAVLGWNIAVQVFERLALDNFGQIEICFVAEGLDDYLSLRCIVGRNAFHQKVIPRATV